MVFDKSSFAVSRELLGAVESYIDEHYVETHEIKRRQLLDVEREALEEADLISYSLKAELTNRYAFNTDDQLDYAIAEYAYLWYNQIRPHSYNNYLTPFEARFALN